MYVIYPAEDLINLLTRDYHTPTPATTPTTLSTDSHNNNNQQLPSSSSTGNQNQQQASNNSTNQSPTRRFSAKFSKFNQSFNASPRHPFSFNRKISESTTTTSTSTITTTSTTSDTQPLTTPSSSNKNLQEEPYFNFNQNFKSSSSKKSKNSPNSPKSPASSFHSAGINSNAATPPPSPFLARVPFLKLNQPFRRDKVQPNDLNGNPVNSISNASFINDSKKKANDPQQVNLNAANSRARITRPSITITPTRLCEDETFTHYRGQNTAGLSLQRIKLISGENPATPTSATTTSNNSTKERVRALSLARELGHHQQSTPTPATPLNSKEDPVFPAFPSTSQSHTTTTHHKSSVSFSLDNNSPVCIRGNSPFAFGVVNSNNNNTQSSSSGASASNFHHTSGTNISSNNPSTIKMMAGSILGNASSSALSGTAAGNTVTDPTSLKDLLHPSLNETLKSHNALTFKLIRIVSDFTTQLSQLHEQHAVELQLLVDNFRKRNAELRKERPPCSNSLFQVWETLLQEVELDAQSHSDMSGSLGRQVARSLLEKTFFRKIQSRKIFAHRESLEVILNKTEALLASTYRDYCDACIAHIQQGNQQSLQAYVDAHNAYVFQLRSTNSMLKEYHTETLPALLQELDEIYMDLSNTLSESILHGAELVVSRTQETNRRYDTLSGVCRNVNGHQDLRDLVRSLTVPVCPNQRHAFTQPVPLIPSVDGSELNLTDKSHVPVLKDEIIVDRPASSSSSARSRHESLKKEMVELESEMKQLQDSLDTLIRMQQRSLDSNLFNKANELQEEISMKRFDLRVAQMHLAAIRAQTRTENPGKAPDTPESSSQNASALVGQNQQDKYGRDNRKMSVSSSNKNMKSKWINAFRSLKTPGPTGNPSSSSTGVPTKLELDKKNGKDKEKQGEAFQIFENHIFQEYTYKKITPCDICSQVLRGHTKQGLRCRLCKLNVHTDCQSSVSKCLPKTRLLRRQRSTSELETRLNQMANEQPAEDDNAISTSNLTKYVGGNMANSNNSGALEGGGGGGGGGRGNDEPDLIYQVLKQATDMKKPGSGSSGSNGLGGSSQTLYSQHESSVGPGGRSNDRRSNPSVNVTSGASTPGAIGGAAQALASSSSGRRRGSQDRRESFISNKSVSADPSVPGPSTSPIYLHLPSRPRCISLPDSPKETPHSPRRRKLDLRMKSFSLDSPESTEHANRRRCYGGSHSTSHSQYWKPSCYTNEEEGAEPVDDLDRDHELLPEDQHQHHSNSSSSMYNSINSHVHGYGHGMVHSKSASNQIMLSSSSNVHGIPSQSHSNSNSCASLLKPTASSSNLLQQQQQQQQQMPPLKPSSLLPNAQSDLSFLSTAQSQSQSQNQNQLQSPSFASLNHFGIHIPYSILTITA